MLHKEIEFLVDSDPNQGASNVSSDGSSFTVNVNDPFIIPRKAKNVYLSVSDAEIWWTIPNIVTGSNDQFEITDTGADSGTAYSNTVTIPQGLYSLSQLASQIETLIVNDGAAQGIITFSEDTAQGKVRITANYTGISIDFTIANSVRTILGFDSQTLGPSASKPLTWTGDNVAAFNTVNYFLLHSDLVAAGMRFNNTYTNIIAKVLIDVQPGSQITYSPFNPTKIDASSLKTTPKTSYRFWMTDESNNSVNTANESYSMRIKIEWDEPINSS